LKVAKPDSEAKRKAYPTAVYCASLPSRKIVKLEEVSMKLCSSNTSDCTRASARKKPGSQARK